MRREDFRSLRGEKKRGFTLLELLFVLAILGLLLALVFVRVGAINHWQEQREVKQLRNDLYLARNLSLIKNQSSQFIREETAYRISCGDQEYSYQMQYLRFVEGADSGELEGPIIFTATGSPSQAGHFFVQGQSLYRVTIPVAWTRMGVYRQ